MLSQEEITMNNEIKILLGNKTYSVFMQKGFFAENALDSPLHKHYHTEIQFVLDGNSTCVTANERFELQSGYALAIPSNTYHYTEKVSEGTKRVAVFIDKEIKEARMLNFQEEFISYFFKEINAALKTNNFFKLQCIIPIFCSQFFDCELMPANNINYSFLIEDFFTLNYSTNVRLQDLAKHLNVSEKHASRLLYQYTGNNFTEEITKRRMEIAEIMIARGEGSRQHIAEHVGYNSYSGFFKAYEKYLQKKGTK